MKLDTLKMQSNNDRSVREADRYSKTDTEGHRHVGKKSKEKEIAKMDEELADIRAEIEKLELKMRQVEKSRWVHKWPMKMQKVKWPIRQLMVIRQRMLLKKWLRYAKILKATEEEMIDYCWPETRKGLDDWDGEEDKLGSFEDLKDCQEGRIEIPVCQEGNEMRSVEDLMDCQEDSEGILHC
jgi:hypothetical protein